MDSTPALWTHLHIALFTVAVIIGLKFALNHAAGGKYAHFQTAF